MKSGYSGSDSMREKAERLFGDAVKGVDNDLTLSASAPSKTPMRKYAKGGSVLGTKIAPDYASREGTMMPKKSSTPIQGGSLTDMHMPKKDNTAKDLKKGGSATLAKEGASYAGKHKGLDQTVRADSRDVGSVKEVASPKKSTMLRPKPASNGSKKSSLNVESVKEFSAMKKGGCVMNGMSPKSKR